MASVPGKPTVSASGTNGDIVITFTPGASVTALGAYSATPTIPLTGTCSYGASCGGSTSEWVVGYTTSPTDQGILKITATCNNGVIGTSARGPGVTCIVTNSILQATGATTFYFAVTEKCSPTVFELTAPCALLDSPPSVVSDAFYLGM